MQKQWVEKTDSKGNKILINPDVVYTYSEDELKMLNEYLDKNIIDDSILQLELV